MYNSRQYQRNENIVRIHLDSASRISGTTLATPSFQIPDFYVSSFDINRPVYCVFENFVNDQGFFITKTGTQYNVQGLSNLTGIMPPYTTPLPTDNVSLISFSNHNTYVTTNLATHQKYVESTSLNSIPVVVTWDNMPCGPGHSFSTNPSFHNSIAAFQYGPNGRTQFSLTTTCDTLGIPLDSKSLRSSSVWNFKLMYLNGNPVTIFDIGNYMMTLCFFQKPTDAKNT